MWVVVKSVVFFCSLSVVKDKITRESEKQKWRRIGRIHDIRCHNLLFHGNCDFLVTGQNIFSLFVLISIGR